jgi:hypothetical protein
VPDKPGPVCRSGDGVKPDEVVGVAPNTLARIALQEPPRCYCRRHLLSRFGIIARELSYHSRFYQFGPDNSAIGPFSFVHISVIGPISIARIGSISLGPIVLLSDLPVWFIVLLSDLSVSLDSLCRSRLAATAGAICFRVLVIARE